MGLLPMSPEKYLQKGLLVKEPVYQVLKSIDIAPTRKIVLSGPIGGGKSTVLWTAYKEGKQSVYICDNPVFNVRSFSREEKEHFYELIIARRIYNYLREHMPIDYVRHFERILSMIKVVVHTIKDPNQKNF
jgi:predicted ABC-type ATPase